MARKTPGEMLKQAILDFESRRRRWDDLHENGGSDPFWSDGVNLNLVRNQLHYYQSQMREICAQTLLPLPECAGAELPPEVEDGYMAKADEIRDHAAALMARFKANSGFSRLMKIADRIQGDENQWIVKIARHVRQLGKDIEDDDLVRMRLFLKFENRNFEDFRNAAESAAKISDSELAPPPGPKVEQISLFPESKGADKPRQKSRFGM